MTIEVTRLPSGLRVATDRMSHVETASVGVWIKAGSRSEAEDEHGIAHLLEHMAFKGTRQRSAKDIAVSIEAVGGDLNAATSLETTTYHARVLKGDVGLAVEILADILQDSVFDRQELRREQNVIVQEIGAALDTPEDLVFDLFQQAAFPGQPIGRPILGTVESVTSFERGNLVRYLDRHYRAPAMVLAAAGAVDHAALAETADRLFRLLPNSFSERPLPARYVGGEQRIERDLEQVNLVVGLQGVPWGSENFEAAQVLANLLGGGMSSRLFQEAREKRGLCYAIQAFHWGFEDIGLLGVSAATGQNELKELLSVTAQEVTRVEHDAEDEEVERVKTQLKASLLMGLESSMARAERLARQLLAFGRVIPIDEIVGRIEAVDAAGVRALARVILSSSKPTLAAVGPLGRLEQFDRIAAELGTRSTSEQAIGAISAWPS
jgi:predicted Zn-dependent peptidase